MTLSTYKEVWLIDFEFVAEAGELPVPVCMVGREFHSGRTIRLWQDELPGTPPFPVDESCLVVAFAAAAEFGCFERLNWPTPARVLDLYFEFRLLTNGLTLPHGRSLLSALSMFGISSITKAEKDAGRDKVMRGGPYSEADRRDILDYCETDVVALARLLPKMWPGICKGPRSGGQALLRGRYATAQAKIESAGVPIDVPTLERLRRHWARLKQDLISDVDPDGEIFEGTTFKTDRFTAWIARHKMDWPRTEKGNLQLDREAFKNMANRYPQVEPYRQLRVTLAELRLESLSVGRDGRNRVALMPFGAKTGRNAPSSTRSVFGPSAWLRSLMRPEPGMSLAYVDWNSQEIAIAATLSRDQKLLGAVTAGDPYLDLARRAGLVPAAATKESHSAERKIAKACLLGYQYGMGATTLATRMGQSPIDAVALLRALEMAYPDFAAWVENVVDSALLRGHLTSVFGWRVWVIDQRTPVLRNWPIQSCGAEMLRVAACLLTEAGIRVCHLVHDAVVVEAPTDEMADTIAQTQRLMAEASRAVLGGLEVSTSVDPVDWPGRYVDERGAQMWDRVTRLLDRYDAEDTSTRGDDATTRRLLAGVSGGW